MAATRPATLALLKIVWLADTSEKAFVSNTIDYFEKEIVRKNRRNERKSLKEPEIEIYDIYLDMKRADKHFAQRGNRKPLNSKRYRQ